MCSTSLLTRVFHQTVYILATLMMQLYISNAKGINIARKSYEVHNTNIITLSENYFDQSADFSSVSEINLGNNNIFTIYNDAFSDMTMLAYLYLNNNRLTSFSATIPQLKVLDLSYNNIRKFDQSVFQYYPQLKTLKLTGNPLKIVDWQIGYHAKLQQIYISQTQVEILRLEASKLEILCAENLSLSEMSLVTPKLSFLDIQHTTIDMQLDFREFCKINRDMTITVTQALGDVVLETPMKHNCDHDQQLEEINFIEDVLNENQDDNVEADVECKFSTMYTSDSDIILSKDEYLLLNLCFFALVSIVIILSTLQVFIMCRFVSRAKPNNVIMRI